jgi:hypothetical protein
MPRKRRRGVASILALAAASALVAGAASSAGGLPAVPQAGRAEVSASQAPSDSEVRDRTAKLVENQHNDDAALDVYERTEHYLDRTSGANPRVLLDKTYRVVPTGGGTMKLEVSAQGAPDDPQEYRRQLATLRGTLEMMANPNDPRAKTAYDKYQKRRHERAEFLDTARSAFLVKWQDRETRNGRLCEVFLLTPDPNFHPHSIYQDAMAHVTAKIWVDRETNQLVHGEANVTSDIYFGGGLLGKLTRGSKISLEQGEVAPGVWLPTEYQYDYSGRKFLFSFEQHQSIDVSHYKRIGPPAEALAAIQKELAAGKPVAGDP